MTATVLQNDEYGTFYGVYIDAVGDDDLLEALEISLHEFVRFVQEIPLGKHDYRYADGKWTIKEIIQHLIDAERIFTYRALRIARNDKTPLPGFDENNYAATVHADSRSLQTILTELATLRQSTLQLFKSFNDEEIQRKGTASGHPISVRALGFIITGHMKHHQRIFAERYL